jgi:hypothetical protein
LLRRFFEQAQSAALGLLSLYRDAGVEVFLQWSSTRFVGKLANPM